MGHSLKELPSWAQKYILRQKRAIKHLNAQIEKVYSSGKEMRAAESRIGWQLPHKPEIHPIPNLATIVFMGEDGWIEVRSFGKQIEVKGTYNVELQPISTSTFRVELVQPWKGKLPDHLDKTKQGRVDPM